MCLGDGDGGFTCSDVSTDSTRNTGVALGDVNNDTFLDAVFATLGRNRVCLGVWDIIGVGSTDAVLVQVKTQDWPGRGEMETGHVRVYEWYGGAWIQSGADIDGESAGDRSG